MSVEEKVTAGSLWRRKFPGRELVRVERVWNLGGELLVRAHPTHGGRPLVASVATLREQYRQVQR